jgi:ketosteroid isomerase-like protein
MSTELHQFADRFAIERVISSLGRCLDERDFERLRDLFTDDASVTTPGGTATGLDALVDQARRRHSNDDGIQHVITNLLVEQYGDAASVRANLLVSFAHSGPADPAPFLLGEVYRFELRRARDGWRISRLSSTPTWTLNRPPQLATTR